MVNVAFKARQVEIEAREERLRCVIGQAYAARCSGPSDDARDPSMGYVCDITPTTSMSKQVSQKSLSASGEVLRHRTGLFVTCLT